MKFRELRQKLNVAEDLSKDLNPPAMLVLRRRGIRLFPDGQRVALYVNDRYNLTFTVPFGKSFSKDNPIMAQHESTINEYVNVIPGVGTALADLIKAISKKKQREIPIAAKKKKAKKR